MQSRSVRDTLNNLILKSPQNWQTSVGLPFFSIQGTVRAPLRKHAFRGQRASPGPDCALQVVEWDEIRFDVRLMQRVPVRLFGPPPPA